jgi:hypothetical protein
MMVFTLSCYLPFLNLINRQNMCYTRCHKYIENATFLRYDVLVKMPQNSKMPPSALRLPCFGMWLSRNAMFWNVAFSKCHVPFPTYTKKTHIG